MTSPTPATAHPAPRLGCVAIGRNEGERLRACLASLRPAARPVVYVDSGSTDGSVELARDLGAHVVELDLTVPFTAARARNAGFRELRRLHPDLALVQFVDGDCEVVAGWLEQATAFLDAHPEVAAVCGRRRERYPERSIYNRLCDIEWDTPVGPARAFGGDVLLRAGALAEVGGYDEQVIAGEEPELCVRLRARGHGIWRIDADMTLHDAAMSRFGQWWKRNLRAGHAFAEGARLHGAPPERHFVRETRRALFWGALLPTVAGAAFLPTLGASGALLFGYPVSAARVYRGLRRRGRPPGDAALAGAFLTLGKFAEAQGALKFYLDRARGRRAGIIEYKR